MSPLSAFVPQILGNLSETKPYFKPATFSSLKRAHVGIYINSADHGGDNARLFRKRKEGINVSWELLATPVALGICLSNS